MSIWAVLWIAFQLFGLGTLVYKDKVEVSFWDCLIGLLISGFFLYMGGFFV